MPPVQKKSRLLQLLLFLVSFLIVAFAQPDWSALACILASSVGYALFWKAMLMSPSKKGRFCLSLIWFALVEAFHLNWFMADRYVGSYIFLFLPVLFAALGLQFGLISLFIKNPKEMGLIRILGICGGWTLLEWSRLFFLSGFSWDPSGLALTGTLWGGQLASVVGVYGLGFWIFFTNLLALKMFSLPSFRTVGIWTTALCLPYLFGFAHVGFHSYRMDKDTTPPLNALVLQTALSPEAKQPLDGSVPLHPAIQWQRILEMVTPFLNTPIDLIVLSEAAVPYGTDYPIYPVEMVKEIFGIYFSNSDFFPSAETGKVGNGFWAQSLANALNAELVIGLEDVATEPVFEAYNAAFLFHPFSETKERYEKRVLVPMGEYIPFEWCKKILRKYGIHDSYTPGKMAKVFQTSRVPIGMSICYEETYGHLMREGRKLGSQLLINMTNDVWYPFSRLPMVHYLHGRLRAMEGGMPMIRSCNTGVSCGVDALGRLKGILDYECKGHQCRAGVLPLALPLYQFPTIYTLFGDLPVLLFSGFCFVIALFKRKQFTIKDLDISPLHKN